MKDQFLSRIKAGYIVDLGQSFRLDQGFDFMSLSDFANLEP